MDIKKEAKKLLLEVHECRICKRQATVYEENPVTYGPDPYAMEIHDNYDEVWECEDCRYESMMDI